MGALIRIECGMIKEKEVSLKIEVLSRGEDSGFLIHSKKEIQLILHRIAQQGTRAALYYDEGNDFILTTLLGVDEHGVWLDVGPRAADNRRLVQSKKFIFISAHHQVKVQFVAHHIENVLFENSAAFYLPLPDTLLRLQRREYFRLVTPVSNPLKCTIPAQPSSPVRSPVPRREATIMDISGGGVALLCEEHDTELQPGMIYPDCRISLPGVGTLTAAIQVKNTFEVTLRNGVVNRHAGCEFIHLDGEMAILLQRYVARLQSENLAQR